MIIFHILGFVELRIAVWFFNIPTKFKTDSLRETITSGYFTLKTVLRVAGITTLTIATGSATLRK